MASSKAKGHHHVWQSKPPDGKLEWTKSWDERYWDEEQMAANFMFTSPEEVNQLRRFLKEDPGFESSSSWPHLTEWCSACKLTRSVRLVLPDEETKIAMEEEKTLVAKQEVGTDCISQDASTQTPKPKLRRRGGGRESRTRRLLAFQAMLTVKRGLPQSRLLSKQKTDARSSEMDFLRLQEESASPALKVRKEKTTEKEENKEVVKANEENFCPREGILSSGSPIFTLRNSQTGVSIPPSKPHTIGPDPPPFPPPPLFTPPFLPPHQTPQYCTTPAANWGFCGGCHCWGPVLPIWVAQ